jgi:hypothetical protein
MKSQNRKSLASVDLEWYERRKNMALSTLLLLKLGEHMSLHHPNRFKLCGTVSYWGLYKTAER